MPWLDSSLKSAFSIANLNRARKWLLSDPSPQGKNYVRHIYKAHSLNYEKLIEDLRSNLFAGTYTPTAATKFYYPKASGLQRVITVLSIDDQIVYQSLANEIAEHLYPVVKRNYGNIVFGNLYAGKARKFFYKPWQKGYQGFIKAARKAYADGLTYTASFDLTACFDSIDHRVLTHFLKDLDLSADYCTFLTNCLGEWAKMPNIGNIPQGQGIPQGPQASGLLAECVLRHFDTSTPKSNVFRYIRYVDDIRLFSNSEQELRKRLVQLDTLSRSIGLFPQSSKIHVHQIKNIDEELKLISIPGEPSVRRWSLSQIKLEERIKKVTPSYQVSDETKFKFYLGAANPKAILSSRVLRVLDGAPHLFIWVFGYLSKASTLPLSTSKGCLELLKKYDLYSAFAAGLIDVLRDRIHEDCITDLVAYCENKLRGNRLVSHPDARLAIVSTLLKHGKLTWSQKEFNFSWTGSWLVRSSLIQHIDIEALGKPNAEYLINKLLRDRSPDVAITAADFALSNEITVRRPQKEIHQSAQKILRHAGVLGRVSTNRCLLSETLKETIGLGFHHAISWKRVFTVNPKYNDVLRKVTQLKSYSQTDATAWVNIADVINDLVLEALFPHDGTIGNYTIGSIGSNLQPTSRFASKYPKLFLCVKAIHDKRLESELSHPITRATGKPTRRIKFDEMEKLTKLMRAGYQEMLDLW